MSQLQNNSGEFFFKVVLIGAPSVGKTSILNRFVEDEFSQDYKATIGADFRTKEFEIDGQTVLLQIWDTAGQERFRALAAPFYRGANICVLVFDVSQRMTFEAIEQWRNEFLHHVDVDESKIKSFPFILLGNKTDLGIQVTKQEVNSWINNNNYNMEYIETSAKDGINIQQSFEKVAKLCMQALPATSSLYNAKIASSDHMNDDDNNNNNNNNNSKFQPSLQSQSQQRQNDNISLEQYMNKPKEDIKKNSNCYSCIIL
jgi:Ras-related protein Rab-7A